MGVYTREEIAMRILPVAQRYHIPAIYLFGSYARGTATGGSDIDLLIDTAGTALTDLFELGGLYCELEEALGKPIDLITVSSFAQKSKLPAEDDFKETVLKERVCIYAVS